MKGIVITPQNTAYIEDYEKQILHGLQKTVGGYIEVCHPAGLEEPLLMIVNESGKLDPLAKVNTLATMLCRKNGFITDVIVGNAVIMQEQTVDGEPDIYGFCDGEAQDVLRQVDGLLVKLAKDLR